jgi:hypothetical protein
MKKILAVLVLVLFGAMSYAQWSPGPGNVYLQTTGNVGIGITAPTNDLQINDAAGPATIVLNTDVTVPAGTGFYTLGQYDMRWLGNNADYYRNVLRRNRDNNHTEMLQTLHNSAGTTMAFLWVDMNTANFEMRSGIANATFINNGNIYFNNNTGQAGAVGIGVTSIEAGVKLAVSGKVTCKEIEVKLAGFPDYVFANDYKLRSLYDVENYINLNKHLPDFRKQCALECTACVSKKQPFHSKPPSTLRRWW